MNMNMDANIHMTVYIKMNAKSTILWNTNININNHIDKYVKVEMKMNKNMYDYYYLCEDANKYDWRGGWRRRKEGGSDCDPDRAGHAANESLPAVVDQRGQANAAGPATKLCGSALEWAFWMQVLSHATYVSSNHPFWAVIWTQLPSKVHMGVLDIFWFLDLSTYSV